MKLGIISDTHDNLVKIKKVVELFNLKKVSFVIHCGDFIAPFSLNPFKDLNCGWAGVFGNNDGEKKGLTEKSEGRIRQAPYFLELASRKIAVTHEFNEYDADIILSGHTHKSCICRDNPGKIFINPGEAGGWIYGESSLVILDLESMRTEIIKF